jgi:hypothetical protein
MIKPILKNHEDLEIEEEEQEELKPNEKEKKKLKVIEPIVNQMEFSNPDEFNEYISDKSLKTLTTYCLNRMYKIPGYRIGRVKGEITIKRLCQSRLTRDEKINERLDVMEDRINEIIKVFNARF